jgi:predicted nucleic acid-binding protein
VYVDSSFLVPLYVQDQHSVEARRLMGAKPDVWLTPLNIAEFSHAIGQQVFLGKVSPLQSDQVRHNFASDMGAGLWLRAGMPEQAFERCSEIGRRHAAKLGIRTLDSLHLACALELKVERFWTFDERQAKVAREEGLKTN